MAELLTRLGDDRFARIHRSRIVNVARVSELRVAAGGDYDVVLQSGSGWVSAAATATRCSNVSPPGGNRRFVVQTKGPVGSTGPCRDVVEPSR